jgi:hypothetical protein
MNFRSSTECPGLLSSSVRSNTLLASPSSNFPCENDSSLRNSFMLSRKSACADVALSTGNKFEQGSKIEGRPLWSKLVLN